MTADELADIVQVVSSEIAAAKKPADLEPVIFAVMLRRIAFLEGAREKLRKISPMNAAIMQSWDDFDLKVARKLRDLAR